MSLETQRRTSEREWSRLSAVLVSMGDAVLVIDPAGHAVLTNAACEQMFGRASASFVPEDEQGHPLPSEATPQRRTAQGESFSMQFTMTAADGARRWFEANGQPIINDGHPHGGVVVIRDITDRSLRRLQDQFLAMASHELRTPLTSIGGFLEMLLRVLPAAANDERPRRYATQALRQTQRLTELVSDLLDVTRLQTGKFSLHLQPTELVSLVTQAVETGSALTHGQLIELETDPGPILVRGDAGRLEQVFFNVLTNAISYAPNTKQIDVRLRHAAGEAILEVRDYGPGISPSDRDCIFSRFYQVERLNNLPQHGLGLGLFIAREIVTAHCGRIGFSSIEGAGTTFTICLPLLAPDTAATAAVQAPAAPDQPR